MPSWIYRTVLAALSGLCKLFQSARNQALQRYEVPYLLLQAFLCY